MQAMRVATWNVNGLRARLDFVGHWLDARQPDVVGLQELKLTDEQFKAAIKRAGYECSVQVTAEKPAGTADTPKQS